MGLNSMLLLHLTGSVCISLLLGFTSALRGPGTVHGYIGRSLSVTCHYDRGYRSYYKYWCKGADWGSCTIVVKTRGSEAEVKAGRTSIKDNHTCSCFTVTLEDLREADRGEYWCIIERYGTDLGIQVTVVPGCFSESLSCPRAVQAPLGGLLSILCNYTDYTTNNKYCCREAWDSSCKKIITTKSSLVEKQGKITINDSHSLHTFSMIIENVTLEDAGKYWCGIDRSLMYDLYHPVTVEVFRESLPPTTTIVVTTGYFSTVHISTTSVTETTTSSSPPLSSELLLPIVLLVLLVVLLVGGLLVMWRLKKRKAAKACGHTLLSTVPNCAEGNVSKATIAASVGPNYKTPSPSPGQDLNGTSHVEYASVKRTPAPPSQPQVPRTNTEDVSYATIKFPAQDERAIYANFK